jgi:hypothetical protein
MLCLSARLQPTNGSIVHTSGESCYWPVLQPEAIPAMRRRFHRYRQDKGLTELIQAIKDEGIAYRKEEQREDRSKTWREWITIALITLTFFAVCYQVYEMIKVYDPIQQQAEASQQAAQATVQAADAAAWPDAQPVPAAHVKAGVLPLQLTSCGAGAGRSSACTS